jgi:DNA-binding response OmpR family regulator
MKVSKKQLEFYSINKNLLIVEDEITIQNTLVSIFKDFFQEVFVASNGQEALNIFEQNKIDLIISDITMPVLDGIEMSRKIRLISDVPIIILSAIEDSQKLIDLINIGIDKFLTKPFTFEHLAQMIINILENQSYKDLVNSIQYSNFDLNFQAEEKKSNDKLINTNDINTPLDLFKYLIQTNDKAKIHSKYHSIFIDYKLLEKLFKDIIIFASNIADFLDHARAEELLHSISKKFLSIHYKLLDFDILKPLSDIIFEYHLFFSKFKNLDELSSKQIDELLDLEEVFYFLKKSIKDIFVEYSSQPLRNYYHTLETNLDILEANVLNADKMVYN